ncbi:MAG: hypothetical protein C4325_03745 [Blastocatellia bacterium]
MIICNQQKHIFHYRKLQLNILVTIVSLNFDRVFRKFQAICSFRPHVLLFLDPAPVYEKEECQMPAQIRLLGCTLPSFCSFLLLLSTATVFSQEHRNRAFESPFARQDLFLKTGELGPTKLDLDSVASISGRISDPYSHGIRGAVILIFDMHDNPPQIARSNTLGFYRFDRLTTGEDYIITVLHSKYFFLNNSRSFTLSGTITDMNFQADEF